MATKSKKNSKNKASQGPDLLTIVVVLIAVVLVVVLISKYKEEKGGGEGTQPTGTVTATIAPEEPTQELTPEAPTPTAEVTPEPEATPEAPTPTEEPVLSQSEAESIVRKIVQLDTYSSELLDDHLMLDGAEYYSFCINDANGVGRHGLML